MRDTVVPINFIATLLCSRSVGGSASVLINVNKVC